MNNIIVNNIEYQVINNEKEAIDINILSEKITEYYDDYDYIVGDWAYGKLRLKGFCNKENKLYKEINNIDNLENYIKDNCAYGCKWFCIKRIVKENNI